METTTAGGVEASHPTAPVAPETDPPPDAMMELERGRWGRCCHPRLQPVSQCLWFIKLPRAIFVPEYLYID